MMHYLLYRAGLWLAQILPRRFCYTLACIFADLHFLLSRKDRRAVCTNLRAVMGGDEKKIRRSARLVFRNFGKYLADFFRFSKLNKAYLKRYVSIEGLEHVEAALRRGNGMVALTAHLGNWELAGAVMGVLGYPLYAVALSHTDKRINKFFISQRQSKGVRVISVGMGLRQCFQALKGNGIVALLGDRDFSQKGLMMKFFGRDVLIPEGAAVFALKMDCPVVPGFMIRTKDERFRLIFEPAIIYTPSGDYEKDLRLLTELCVKEMEKYIRRYPEQWYIFREFWVPVSQQDII